MMNREEIQSLFDKWVKKLRLVPAWDIRLEWVDDPSWRKTGDFKIDCDDKKAIILLNGANPKQEKVVSTIEKLNRFKEMKLGTATAKNLWIQRLDYYIGFYEKLKAQLDNSTAIL